VSEIVKPTLVAYDIRCNASRRQALRMLEGHRLGGQKSVHECLLSVQQAHALAAALAALMDPATDRVLFAWPHLSRGCFSAPKPGAAQAFQGFRSNPPGKPLPLKAAAGKQVARHGGGLAVPGGSWQLLSYDIACPKRIQRVSSVLKKVGIHTQYSVFLLHLTATPLRDCISQVSDQLHRNDDLRVYPIDAPELLWRLGADRNPGLLAPVNLDRASHVRQPPAGAGRSFLQKLLQPFAKASL